MEDEDIKCKECPSARHGFDRHASHNAGRYVCECESFVCPSEQLRQRVQELEELLKESYKDADEVLRPRVQELEFALAETEALEMSHGERIEKLTAEREELLAALERSLESFEYIAKYGNSCGHSQLRIPDLKAVIASVEEKS